MPYNDRPAQLNDTTWLAGQYATRSAAQIARDLHLRSHPAARTAQFTAQNHCFGTIRRTALRP